MPAACIFVIYASAGDERGTEVARQLTQDLQAHGASVVTADETLSDEDLLASLNRDIPRCQYLIFVQTPPALQSLRVLTAVNMALHLVAQQRMRGVLRLLAGPEAGGGDENPLWEMLRSFDANWDYPRARDRILLELGLFTFDDEEPAAPERFPPLSASNLALPFPVGGSSGSGAPTPLPRSAALLDRPEPLRLRHHVSHWWMGRSPRLWRVLASAVLILGIVLALAAVALQVGQHGLTNPPHSTSLAPLSSGRAPTDTPPSTSPGGTPASADTPSPTPTTPGGTPTISGTLTANNGTPAPTVGSGTDPGSLQMDCHTDIIAQADAANPPYPNRPYAYPLGPPWLLNVGDGTLTGQLYYCPQENSVFGIFSFAGISTTGSCSLLANYGPISVSKNIPTIYNPTSPRVYGTCSQLDDQFMISPKKSANRQEQTKLGETYAGDTWQLCWTTQSQQLYCSQPTATPGS